MQLGLRTTGVTVSSDLLLPDSRTKLIRIKISPPHPKPKSGQLSYSETGFSSYVTIVEKSYTAVY